MVSLIDSCLIALHKLAQSHTAVFAQFRAYRNA